LNQNITHAEKNYSEGATVNTYPNILTLL